VKTVTLVDPQGKDVAVPQEQVVPLLRSGFGARPGQRVTLGDERATEVPLERVIDTLNRGLNVRLEGSQAAFQRGAEERFGGGAGLAAGLGYGALQGATLGLGGKGLIESGLVAPETLAQLEAARGGGVFSTIGAGEMLGLGAATALTGGAAAAEGAAARTLGQTALRSAAREAAIGAGYGAGSEITQAAIEQREARPLEAATGGAVVGGTIGALMPALGAGIKRARGAATEAERTLATTGATPETAAQAAYDERFQTMLDDAFTKADEVRGIADRWNAVSEKVKEKGFASADAGLKAVGSKIEKLTNTLANANRKLGEAQSLEKFHTDLADTVKSTASNKRAWQRQITVMEEQAARTQEELAAVRGRTGQEAREATLQSRLDTYIETLGVLRDGEKTLGEFAQKGLDLQALAVEEATAARARARAVGQYDRTLAKLKSSGEQLAEAAGISADEAQKYAARVARNANVRTAAQIEVDNALAEAGIKSNARHREFTLAALRSGEAAPEEFRQIVQDMIAAERGFATQLKVSKATGAPEKIKASIFAEAFRHPELLARLSPENAAYVKAVAEIAPEVRQLRSGALGGRPKRIPGIVKALEDIEDLVGKEAYDAIKAQATTDMAAREIIESDLGKAMNIAEKYRITPREAAVAAEEATVKAAAPAVEAPSRTLVAATPAETIGLRTVLGQQESLIQSFDKQLADIAAKREALVKERQTLAKTLRSQKSEARKQALSDRIEDIKEKIDRSRTAYDEVTANREALATDRAALRQDRAASAEQRAIHAENVRMARETLAQQRRALRTGELDAKVTGLKGELAQKKALRGELEVLRDEHQAVAKELDALTAAGERNLIKNAARSQQLVPLDELRIFEQSMKAFRASPEGKQLLADIAKANKTFAQKVLEPENLLAALSGGTTVMGLMGGGLGTTLIGITMAAMGGKKGLYKAASTMMNPVRFWTATGNAMSALERLTPQVARTSQTKSGYTFSVPEANAYIDSILQDRAAAEKAFDRIARSGAVDSRNLEDARSRFNAAIDYLERKRPMTSNGADAQDFARSVAVLKNPDLLASFIKQGTLRQQDVDMLQRVSPESYDNLKRAVEVLHRENPKAVVNLAPLFKIMMKDKFLMRTTLPLTMLQQISGSTMQFQQPVTPKSEVAAARGRPPAPSKSNIAGNVELGPPSAD
jgi:hypothetical protein